MREAGIEPARCRGDMALAVRRMILQMDRCEIAFGQIGNGDRQRALASANVPQRLLPKNSPKRSNKQAHQS
jgi:hypothetical protein